MSVNHIFIFTKNHNQAVQELLDFGFTEGSNRVHLGQGTQNRKFNFNNFFLEILWVHDTQEVTNTTTKPTKLHERANWKDNECSPFGLCLNYSTNEHDLFKKYLKYEPLYLPKGMEVQVLTNEEKPFLPWTFRWKSDLKSQKIMESTTHKNKIKSLTKACFAVKELECEFIKFFKNDEVVFFEQSNNKSLTLEFDNKKTNQIKKFDTIPLIIKY